MKEKKLNISVGHLKIMDHLILGISRGRLQTHGLDLSTLENIPMNSWEQIKEGLRQGELQGAFLPVPLAMDLFASGLDIRFLMFAHRCGGLMITNPHTPIKQLSDLRGKTILIPHTLSVHHMLVHKLLASAGLEFNLPPKANTPENRAGNQVRAESVNPGLMPPMLEADQDHDIAACMGPEPYGTLAVTQGIAQRFCTSDSLWKDHPGCGLVVSADLISTQGEALEELVSHLFQSAQLLATRTDPKILDWTQEFLGQDRSMVQQTLLNIGLNFDPKKLLPDKEKLEIIQGYMTAAMEVMTQTIEVDAFINPAYAQRALEKIDL